MLIANNFHAKATALRLLKKGHLGSSSVTYLYTRSENIHVVTITLSLQLMGNISTCSIRLVS